MFIHSYLSNLFMKFSYFLPKTIMKGGNTDFSGLCYFFAAGDCFSRQQKQMVKFGENSEGGTSDHFSLQKRDAGGNCSDQAIGGFVRMEINAGPRVRFFFFLTEQTGRFICIFPTPFHFGQNITTKGHGLTGLKKKNQSIKYNSLLRFLLVCFSSQSSTHVFKFIIKLIIKFTGCFFKKRHLHQVFLYFSRS